MRMDIVLTVSILRESCNYLVWIWLLSVCRILYSQCLRQMSACRQWHIPNGVVQSSQAHVAHTVSIRHSAEGKI